MRATPTQTSSFQLPFVLLSLVCAAMALLLVAVSSMMATQYDEVLSELNEVRNLLAVEQPAAPAEATPIPNGAMWSLGTGGYDDLPYYEWVAVYPESTLWQQAGAPSLRFTDHAQEREDFQRDFEIGFYRYGPTWYSQHFITEFWLGSGNGGVLSVAGNNQGGGQLQVRNPLDDDSVMIDFTQAQRPTIRTESGNPLYLNAKEGLVSESAHIFEAGIALTEGSETIGVVQGGWNDDRVIVSTTAVNETSIIMVTPTSEPKGRWWVGGVEPGKSFTVFSSAANETMHFQWFIVDRR